MWFRKVLPVVCLGWLVVQGPGIGVSLAGGDDPAFGSHWHDGRAELNGYRFSVTRYGQERKGQAVLVYVTEPFSRSKMVKADDPSKDPDDTFEVFKLNMVRDFQTGIYDYNTMVSVFARSDRFVPVKITLTSAEWCGHVYEELRFDPRRVTERFYSYFEDESSAGTLESKPGGVTEDGLWILLRGLRGPFLEPGETQTVPFLPGAFYRRLTHRPVGWVSARISRLDKPQAVEVPAGSFLAVVYRVETTQGRVGLFFVEQAYPHRVVRWQWQNEKAGSDEAAESGQLAGTKRLKYWQLHGNGHERYLKDLGLSPTR